MQESVPIGCVIMASGLSQRFGTNKLLADFCEQPMLCRAFAATDTLLLTERVVVTRSAEIKTLCEQHSIPVIFHTLSGRNDTVRLGLSALLEKRPDLAGCMFLPVDQPLLTTRSVENLIRAFYRTKNGISADFRTQKQVRLCQSPAVPFYLTVLILFNCCSFPRAKAAVSF